MIMALGFTLVEALARCHCKAAELECSQFLTKAR